MSNMEGPDNHIPEVPQSSPMNPQNIRGDSAFWVCLQSPERLQQRLEEIAAEVERERGLVAEAERRCKDLQTRADTISKVWANPESWQRHIHPKTKAPCMFLRGAWP